MAPVLGAIVVFAVMAWHYRWMSDDGLIHLRVVRQLQAGNGPVYNPGSRVEVTTSIAWVALLLVLDLLIPAPLEWIAVVAGITLAVAGLGLLAAGSVRLWTGMGGDTGRDTGSRSTRSQRTRVPFGPQGGQMGPEFEESAESAAAPGRVVWLPLGLGLMVALAPAWHMASAGLENGLAWVWLGGCWLGLVGCANSASADPTAPVRVPLWLPVLIGLGLLIRPDLAIFVVAWLGLLLVPAWRIRNWRGGLAVLAAAAAIPAAYQVFRMGYFGLMVPNTAVTKEAGRLLPSRGWDFLVDQLGDHLLWLGLLAFAVAGVPFVARLRGERLRVAAVTMAAGAVSLAYIAAIGGDFMGSRLILIPILGLAAPVAAVPLGLRAAEAGGSSPGPVPVTRLLAATLVPVTAWMLVAGFALREGDDNFDLMSQNNTVLAADVPVSPDPADAQPGVFYGSTPLPGTEPAEGLGPSVYSGLAIGVPSYRADPDTPVIDLLGLGEPVVSHMKLEGRGDLAGHEKTMPVWWFLARATAPGSEERVDPNLETTEPFYTGDFGSEPAGTLAERTALTRAALGCEPVADLIDAAEAPMDAGRFVENLLGAPARTLRRIPANPEALLDASHGLSRCRENR